MLFVCPQQSYMWLDTISLCVAHATQKANDMNSTLRKKKVRQEESWHVRSLSCLFVVSV